MLFTSLILALAPLPGFSHAVPSGQPARPAVLAPFVQEAPDSAEILQEVRDKQRDFERYRESRLVPTFRGGGGGCDDMVGRLCFRFGDEEEEAVPPEPPEVRMARLELLRALGEAADAIPGDRWILGQRTYYLVADGSWREVELLLDGCLAEAWWCAALRGYAAQHAGDHVSAQEQFEEALGTMPEAYRTRFDHDVRYFLDREGQTLLDGLQGSERSAFLRGLWVLSDPLYLVEGNDRLAEHRARVVGTFIREDAENPYDLPWEEDLAELVVRYGQEVGWSRGRTLGGAVTGRDTRHVIGHHDPRSQQFVPPTDVLRAPLEVPVGAWSLEDRTPFSGYAPDYAPDFGLLDAQVARFRRGDSLHVVAAYRPRADAGRPPRVAREAPESSDDPFGSLTLSQPASDGAEDDYFAGPVRAGAFLVSLDGTVHARAVGESRSGVHTLTAPAGDYVGGVEVFDPEGRKAWRARGSVTQRVLPPGLTAVSDILVLDGDGPVPTDLEEATPRALPRVAVRRGQAMTLAWEVYGLRPGEAASVTVGFNRADEGFLRRLGEFLRVVETDEPIVVRFEDAAPDRLGTVFRAIDVDLPSLEPGSYDVILEVDLAGRDPMVSSRRIEILPEEVRP